MSSTLAASATTPRLSARSRQGPVLVAVGDDGSRALRTAAALDALLSQGLHVFSAVEPISAQVFSGEPVMLPPTFEEERRAERIAHVAARLADVAGPGHCWQMEVEPGAPASEIVRRARELDASLIVMGIGRHKPIDRLLASETTLRVIRRASCPVLAVASALEHPPREVVVATDFSAESALAAECAATLLSPGGTLRLVHVWEPSTSPDPQLRTYQRQYAESLPRRFEKLVAELRVPDGTMVAFEVREGKTVQQLLESAESHHADVIAAGRHGLSGIARLFIGSVTTALVRAASCAVLVTPKATFGQLDRWERALFGTSTSASPAAWTQQLEEFTRRNRGRRTALEVDDPLIGAQAQEIGYALLGASYDPHDRRVELMFGLPRAGAPHLTRGITNVDSVSVLTAPTGQDTGLRIGHGEGQTVVTFPAGP